MGLQGETYKIDITFVIDATGSMTPLMNQVKARALVMHEEITEGLKKANKEVESLRIRVIDFADFASEGDDAVHQSPFYNMPEEKAQFESRINGINYEMRGGDVPENGLEALFIAMNSDWVRITGKGRHIIVVITDAPPLHLGERAGCIGYSDEYPDNVASLEEIWNEKDGQTKMTKLSYRNRRLILFVPEGNIDGYSWDDVSGWSETVNVPIVAGRGFEELSFDTVIAEIVRSVA